MPASDLQKRAILLIFVLAVIFSLIVLVPLVEGWLRTSFLPQFGLVFAQTPDNPWSLEASAYSAMRATYATALDTTFRIVRIVLWMAVVIAVVRFVSFLVVRAAQRKTPQSEVPSILKTVFSIVVYIIAFSIIFQIVYPDTSLSGVFAGSTIFGIVVGLALQDTLGNLFAGIALQADQPFQAGDVISISNHGVGTVESISWRGVKIRTFQNKLLVISNSVLGKETIEVAPREGHNARLVFFNTLYTNSPAKTAQVVREAVRQVENVDQKYKPIVRIRDLADNGIDWEIKYWLIDYSHYNDTDAQVRQRVWYVFRREGLDFAYPTRTIHIEGQREEIKVEEVVNTRVERLNRVRIFAPLSDDETEKLATAATARVFAPGESIVRKGQQGTSMFVVVRGSVRVQIPERGGSKTLNELGENSFFGEMSLLTGEPRSATVVATEETEVLQISKNAMKPIFENNPDLVQTIYEIIEERRVALDAIVSESEAESEKKKRGVVRSIKKFFGLRS